MKASHAEVRKAIEIWEGNVSAAADAVGLRRESYRKRLKTLGIDPEDY
ncbi:hypothetical protein LCGC14_2730020, partial [marine sediment metagenome]